MSDILQRILRQIGCEDLPDRLAGLPGADLNTLTLEVFGARAAKSDAPAIVKTHAGSRFTQPSALDPVRYHLLESELLALAAGQGIAPVLLSPVAPLGSCSAFGCVHQNKVISAARGVEVLADPTNMLALIIASRLKGGGIGEDETAHLCATARVTRAQQFSGRHSFAHFGIFSIVSRGKDTGSYACEQALLTGQLDYYRALTEEKYSGNLSITLRRREGYPDAEGFFDRMSVFVRSRLPGIPLAIESDHADNGYYKGLNFKLYLHTREGEQIEIGDGGFVDWLQKANGSKKERCLISGIGLDRLMMI